MKKLILSMVLLLGLTVMASENNQKQCQQIKDGVAQSGCCSWHGGVCGCSLGRAQCCDGSLSPSCGCLKDEDIKEPVIKNTPETIPQA
jgi:hypothetical protein